MIEVLSYINEVLHGMGMPYEFGSWSQSLRYPYFVGGYIETDTRFEDNSSSGLFEINGWTTGSRLELMEWADKIHEDFLDIQVIRGDTLLHITSGGAQDIPTGMDGLYRITITLNVQTWKGK